jgi:alkanesulfonate monooxygenase SsuD/methylene tetrahydromethanopterin reductase-like flavin-dependent oxidoreductase (luciferase family)
VSALRHLAWNINPVIDAGHPHVGLTDQLSLLRRAAREFAHAGADLVLLSAPAPAYADAAGAAFSASLDPVVLSPLIHDADERIDVVAAVNPALDDPYLAARQVASLFHASRGRAGLALQPSIDPRSVASVTRLQRVPRTGAEIDARTGEWLEVVRALWASWDPDAVVEDFDTHTYADHTRIHRFDLDGEFFSLTGPAETLPFPEGAPLVFAGAYRDGVLHTPALAAADALYLSAPTPRAYAEAEREVREGLYTAGRPETPLFAVLTVLPSSSSSSDGAGLRPFADAAASRPLAAAVAPIDEAGIVDVVSQLADEASFDGLLINQPIDRRAVNSVVDETVPALRALGALAERGPGGLRARLLDARAEV